MKQLTILSLLAGVLFIAAAYPDGNMILKKVDANMTAKTTVSESQMVVYGRRETRTITSKSYAEGNDNAFTDYLSPERDKGTKMLKLGDRLWTYSPSSDRTIQS